MRLTADDRVVLSRYRKYRGVGVAPLGKRIELHNPRLAQWLKSGGRVRDFKGSIS